MDHLDALRATVGAAQVLTGADAQPWETDWRERYRGRSLAVVRPGTTDEVAAVVPFLVSDAGGFTTGAVIDITGGAVHA